MISYAWMDETAKTLKSSEPEINISLSIGLHRPCSNISFNIQPRGLNEANVRQKQQPYYVQVTGQVLQSSRSKILSSSPDAILYTGPKEFSLWRSMMPVIVIQDTCQTSREAGRTSFQEPQLKHSSTEAIGITKFLETNQPSRIGQLISNSSYVML